MKKAVRSFRRLRPRFTKGDARSFLKKVEERIGAGDIPHIAKLTAQRGWKVPKADITRVIRILHRGCVREGHLRPWLSYKEVSVLQAPAADKVLTPPRHALQAFLSTPSIRDLMEKHSVGPRYLWCKARQLDPELTFITVRPKRLLSEKTRAVRLAYAKAAKYKKKNYFINAYYMDDGRHHEGYDDSNRRCQWRLHPRPPQLILITQTPFSESLGCLDVSKIEEKASWARYCSPRIPPWSM